MKARCFFEIADESTLDFCFAYVDTDDYLAQCLFQHEGIDVTVDMEFKGDDDPFKIVMCRIPFEQRDVLLNAVSLLPGLMEHVGRTDYYDYCMDLTMNFLDFIRRTRKPGRAIRASE